MGKLWDVYAFLEEKKKEKKKNIENKVSSTPLRLMGDNIMSCEGNDPCTCAGIKWCTRNKIFLVTFHNPWLLENYLTKKKQKKKKEKK